MAHAVGDIIPASRILDIADRPLEPGESAVLVTDDGLLAALVLIDGSARITGPLPNATEAAV